MQLREAISSVLETTKQETDTYDPWSRVEASVWTKPMLTALANSVKGGKWFNLMDKFMRWQLYKRLGNKCGRIRAVMA